MMHNLLRNSLLFKPIKNYSETIMKPTVDTENIDRTSRSLKTILLHFMLGLLMGGLLLIPLFYSQYFTFSTLSIGQLVFTVIVPMTTATLAALYGDRFLEILIKLVESLSSI
jgi:hypothetical protein